MKKLLTLALRVIVLAAFTGLSSTQERKTGEKPAASSVLDTVRLSRSKSVASQKGCVVVARPDYSGDPGDIYPNFPVNFQKYVDGNWINLTPNPMMMTNSQGVVVRSLPWNIKVRAWIYKPNGQKAYSTVFTCGERYRRE